MHMQGAVADTGHLNRPRQVVHSACMLRGHRGRQGGLGYSAFSLVLFLFTPSFQKKIFGHVVVPL